MPTPAAHLILKYDSASNTYIPTAEVAAHVAIPDATEDLAVVTAKLNLVLGILRDLGHVVP